LNNKNLTKVQIGFSPCPNDTFIFDALINKKIDTAEFTFEAVMEDVETLNKWALQKKLPVTKLSYGVLPLVLSQYVVLNNGSALGKGVGPLLINSKHLDKSQIENSIIALPGEHTTAHLLFSIAYPNAAQKVFIPYNEIEKYISDGHGPGVIIHENRFTYQDKGLVKIIDLGDYWEEKTGNPIPLGGIVVDRVLPLRTQQSIDSLIRKSIEYGFSNYPELPYYVKIHAQEMSEDVMRKHIELYVNNYSTDLGSEGKNAIINLIWIFNNIYQRQETSLPVFV